MLPVSKLISQIHAPFSRKKIYSKHIESIKEHLKPGAVLVTNTEGQLSNLFIDGKYSHAAICSPKSGYVIEAKTAGVMLSNILDFMISKELPEPTRPRIATCSPGLILKDTSLSDSSCAPG
jgi:hypothetical protein